LQKCEQNFKRIGLAFICIFLLILVVCRPSVPEEQVVARVGNEVLSRDIMDRWMQWRGMGPEDRNGFVQDWVNRELLYQEAIRMDLDKSEELEFEKELLEKEYVIQKLLERTFIEKVQVTDQEIQNYYEQNQDLFKADADEVRIFHILTDTREQANLARREIQTGKPFEEVVSLYSTGTFKNNSGDMGYIKKEDVIPEISRVAFHLPENSISQVIESSYGFHIIKVIRKRQKDSIKDLNDVHGEILQHLRVKKERAVYYDLLSRLQNTSKVYVASHPIQDEVRDTTASQ
jgi:peptidyl-prolyl cis-trans isomerase C